MRGQLIISNVTCIDIRECHTSMHERTPAAGLAFDCQHQCLRRTLRCMAQVFLYTVAERVGCLARVTCTLRKGNGFVLRLSQ